MPDLIRLDDAEIDRVDLVDGPATGLDFLIVKAKYTAEQQRTMLANGQALKGPDGEPSYPIGDKADLTRAIHAVGRGAGDHDRIRAYIIRRAKALGATDQIPDNWNADGSLKEDAVSKVAKADTMPDDEAAGSDADELMDDATDSGGPDSPDPTPAPGDPDDPTSAAWESVDAARARAATDMIVQLKALVEQMGEREATEAVSDAGDPDDADNAWDLDGVRDALDAALLVLAKFAVDEQAEADERTEDAEEQAAALGLTVAKAGRVLSAANESQVKAAIAALQQVLAAGSSTPAPAAAPAASSASSATDSDDSAPVAKADDPDPTAAIHASIGKLAGACGCPACVGWAASAKALAAADPDDDGDTDDDTDDSDGTDGTAVDQNPDGPPDSEEQDMNPAVLKSIVAEAVEAALKTTQADHAAVVKSLEDRLATVEAQPAPGGPLLNGAAVMGRDGLSPIEVLQKQMDATRDPQDRADLARAMQVEQLRGLFGAR